MPVTLAQAKVGMADHIDQQVIDEFRRGSLLLDPDLRQLGISWHWRFDADLRLHPSEDACRRGVPRSQCGVHRDRGGS